MAYETRLQQGGAWVMYYVVDGAVYSDLQAALEASAE